jgi:leucyl aminopeptidase
VLVGKGVTFDSGGISLKPPPAMDEMKFDMSARASVLGSIKAAARWACRSTSSASSPPARTCRAAAHEARRHRPQHVGADDRDPQHRRRGPADPLRRNHLCRRFKPAVLLDIATLTGACVIALGGHYAPS